MVFGLTCLLSCSPAKLLWYSSNGIMTYNRQTGQFEVLWENNGAGNTAKCDTVYVYRTIIVPSDSVPAIGE